MPSSDLTALSKAAAALDTAAMNDHGVKWAQVKGHPFWPTQMIPPVLTHTVEAIQDLKQSKGCTVAVQFFGTGEYGWVRADCVLDWHVGVEKKYHTKKTRPFQLGLAHVLQCHKGRFAPGCFPEDWWCAEEEEEEEEDSSDEDTRSRKPPKKRALPAAASQTPRSSSKTPQLKKKPRRGAAHAEWDEDNEEEESQEEEEDESEEEEEKEEEKYEKKPVASTTPRNRRKGLPMAAPTSAGARSSPTSTKKSSSALKRPAPAAKKESGGGSAKKPRPAAKVEVKVETKPAAKVEASEGANNGRKSEGGGGGRKRESSVGAMPKFTVLKKSLWCLPWKQTTVNKEDTQVCSCPRVGNEVRWNMAALMAQAARNEAKLSKAATPPPKAPPADTDTKTDPATVEAGPEPGSPENMEVDEKEKQSDAEAMDVSVEAREGPAVECSVAAEPEPAATAEPVPEAAAGRAVHVQLVVDGEVVRLTLSIVSYAGAACPPSPASPAAEAVAKTPTASKKTPKSSGKAPSGRGVGSGCGTPGSSNRRSSSAVGERTGCGEGCMNRKLMMFCDARVCPSGKTCSNLLWHTLASPSLTPFDTGERGWGVKAGEAIRAGQFLIEYVGELIDDKEVERRLWEAKRSNEPNFYMMEIGPDVTIDARYKGSIARLLNSSCAPNCETQKWRDPQTNETRVGLFTTTAVRKGVELTYDYCFNHFGSSSALSFTCKCGAATCRGTLDANPERHKDYGRNVAVLWDDGTYYPGVVTKFNLKSGDHTIVYNDGDVEVLDLSAVKYKWLPGSSPVTSPSKSPSKPRASKAE